MNENEILKARLQIQAGRIEDLERRAEEYKKKLITENKSIVPNEILYLSPIQQAYKDGYEQGQESMLFEFALEDRGKLLLKIEELKEKLSNIYNCIYCGCSNCNIDNVK